MTENNFICFMAHIQHKECDRICKDLEPYKYIFGMETSDYEHFHFLVEMSDKQYHAFSKKVFKDRYKLRGRATKGAPRQYGKEKNIKDIQKIARYTCKDKNVRTNLTEEELDDLLGQKLEECKNTKMESMENIKKCMLYVEKKWENFIIKKNNGNVNFVIADGKLETQFKDLETWDHPQICCEIINFMIENDINIRRTTIDTYYLYIIARSEYLKKGARAIYYHLYEDKHGIY